MRYLLLILFIITSSFSETFDFVNQKYLFEDLKCDRKIKKGDQEKNSWSNLVNFNFVTGEYICRYNYLDNQDEVKVSEKIMQANQKARNYINHTKEFLPVNFSEKYGSYYFSANENLNLNFIKKKIKTLKTQSNQKQTDFNINIASHKNKNTLSSLISSIITLDPDKIKGIDEFGKLKINDIAIVELNQESKFINQNDGKKSEKQLTFKTVLDGLDSIEWASYVYMYSNISHVLTKLITALIFFGTVYIIYIFSYAKLSKQENSNIKSKTAFIMLISIAFLVPISYSTIDIPTKYQYKNTIENKKVEEQITTSSLAQNAIRYFSQAGITFANMISDSVFYSYLRKIEDKSMLFSIKKLDIIEKQTHELYLSSFNLKLKTDFYKSVCIKSFPDYFHNSGIKTFQNLKKENLSEISIKFNNINQISTIFCKNLEEEIDNKTKINLATYSSILFNVSLIEASLENLKSNKNSVALGLKDYIKQVEFLQNNLGFINIASLPIINQLFTSSDFFTHDVVKKEFNNKHQKTFNHDIKQKYNLSIQEDSFINNMVKTISSNAVWVLVPGFTQQVSGISNFLLTAEDEIDITTKITNMLAIAGGTVASPAAGILIKIAGTLTSWLAKPLIILSIYLISFIASIMLFTAALKALTFIVVAAAATIKTIFYFAEVLIYFSVSPFIVFFAIISKDAKFLKTFLAKGCMTLLVTPSLIVFSIISFMYLNELCISLWQLSINTYYDISVSSNQLLQIQNNSSYIDMLQNSASIAALSGFGEVVIHIITMFLAVFVIFKLQSIILSFVGYSERSFVDEASEVFMHKAVKQ